MRADAPECGYGLGWQTVRQPGSDGTSAAARGFGHDGAYSTRLWIDPQQRLITVVLIQHADYSDGTGRTVQTLFDQAARNAFQPA